MRRGLAIVGARRAGVAGRLRTLGWAGSRIDLRRSIVVVEVWVADEATVALARERWGDLLELDSILRPVDG